MVVRPLIRLKNQPTFGPFALDPFHRRLELLRLIPSNSEENRARRTRCNDHSFVVVVIIVEGREESPVHRHHRIRFDDSSGPPRSWFAVREDLIGAIPRSPSGRCRRSDNPTALLVRANHAQTAKASACLPDRDHSPDGIPVQSRGGWASEHHKSWIRGRIVEARPTFHHPGNSTCDVVRIDRSETTRMGSNLLIEPHEPRISNQVEVFRQVAHNLRREEGRAHSPEAIRVVDANPEDHRSLERERASRNRRWRGSFKYARPIGWPTRCRFELSNSPEWTDADSSR